jgi:deferrochelatase/peroxidase EfeB
MLTRRSLLGAAGVGAAGLAAGRASSGLTERADHRPPDVAFHGEHQAGIVTPAQDRLAFGAFDLTLGSAAELRDLLRAWSAAAERMTRGKPAGDPGSNPLAPPADTGEALDLSAARLTVTIGLGPGVFAKDLGLAHRRPAALRELGPLPGDALEPRRSGGDLCVQACADDPQVAFHAMRNLTRIARGGATLRWAQLGFGRTSAITSGQDVPRNLMGFRDGTNNLHGDDAPAMRSHVWVGGDEPQAWLHGGSYLVARRIRMLIESWDRASLDDQEQTIGRRKLDDTLLPHRGPEDAHVRLADPKANGGAALLRRGYSYTDGIDPASGQLDAGLFFISFQRDPEQFAAVQRRLGTSDALNEYIRHTGSAVFAVPPGAREGGFVGEGLFA